jgi:BolA protein
LTESGARKNQAAIVNQQQTIIDKLAAGFDLLHLDVINESASHNVAPGSESHFKVVLVSESFAGRSRLARHRAVHAVLTDDLAGGVHALAVHTYTPEEWRQRFGDAPMSPDCRGGKAAEDAGS